MSDRVDTAIHRYEIEVEIDADKASFRDVEEAVDELDGVEFAAIMEVREPDEL